MYVPQSEPTVGGAIIGCIAMLVLLIAIVVSVGPLIDYFANYVAIMPDNPYKQYSLEMFPWIYAFVVLGGVMAFALVWRVVIRNIVFDMKGEF